MNLAELQELGLSVGQIKVYVAVLELGNTTLQNIQEKTGIERRNIYDTLNKLIEKGFISYTVERGKRSYQCAHPSKLQEEILLKEQQLAKLKQKLPEITSLFQAQKPDIRAEVFRGDEGIKALMDEALTYKKSYWIGGTSFGEYRQVSSNLLRWFEHWMNRRIELKHEMYDLVDHGTYLKGFEPKNKKENENRFYYYAQLPKNLESPMVILIFGNKVAQILWSMQPFAFVLESEEIKESYMKYFNFFWKET
ncbi:MAG: TrmB family transcriptional regulator [Candidatus Nanoarchaeia archaeon]